jgi:voltage-gated potassium channel
MDMRVAKLSNHVIVCGYGRMGKIIAEELHSRKVPFEIIERDGSVIRDIMEQKYTFLEGDATSDDILRRAGIEQARALVSVVESDAENLYITLSARGLNQNIFILARCSEEAAEAKLYRAGANKVIFPYRLGAKQMAEFILRPNIMEFFEMAFTKGNLHLSIQEMSVPEGSFLDGVELLHSGLRQTYNVVVVGIRKRNIDTMVFNPAVNTKLCPQDILILLGEPEKLEQLADDIR